MVGDRNRIYLNLLCIGDCEFSIAFLYDVLWDRSLSIPRVGAEEKLF